MPYTVLNTDSSSMKTRLRNGILALLGFFGWTILGLSLALCLFSLLVILGNHSEYDCNLSAAAELGVFSLIPATVGAVFAFLARARGKFPRLLAALFASVVLGSLTIAVDAHYFDNGDGCSDQARKGGSLDAITPGMTEAEVVKILGRPQSIHACVWEFVQNTNPSCEKSYVYEPLWAPLVPYYPVVWFDKAGRVLAKYNYSSP